MDFPDISFVLSGATGVGAWLNYINLSSVYLWALSIMSCFIMIYSNQNSIGHEVLLLSFNTKLSFDDPGKNFHFTEVFSGGGAVSKRMQGAQSCIISFQSKIKQFFNLGWNTMCTWKVYEAWTWLPYRIPGLGIFGTTYELPQAGGLSDPRPYNFVYWSYRICVRLERM